MDLSKILTDMNAVINTLNDIEVKGKRNVMNLYGSISVLENIMAALSSIVNEDNEKVEDQAKVV